MVARGGARQSSANAGELDPQLAGRVDIKQYYSGGLAYHNVEPVPQSGFRQMAGTWDLGPVRRRVASVAVTGSSSSLGPHTGAQTIWSGTVAAAIAAVDIASIGVDEGTHAAVVEVETNDGWTQIGPQFEISAVAKGRTFAFAPGAAPAATGIRIVATFSTEATVTLGTVTALAEGEAHDVPRYAHMRHDSGDRYFMALQPGFLDIWEDDAFVAGVYLPTVTAGLYDEVNFYAENATIGIFHQDLETVRVRRAGSAQEWELDSWPYSSIPTADLGGSYATTSDVWEIFLRWTEGTQGEDNDVPLYLSITVNGETTPAVFLPNAEGDPEPLNGTADWEDFAENIQTALRALPSLSNDVTVSVETIVLGATLTITFAEDLAGVEYDLSAQIVNTAEISALPVHLQVGQTTYEPILSAERGWPGVAGLMQDRLAYGDIAAVPSAIAISAAAEYFDLNIEAQNAGAARLDRLRGGQTAERVLAFMESTYALVFSDTRVWFAANRTISRDEPLNYTVTSQVGIVANTEPIDLEGKIYYVGANPNDDEAGGNQVLSLGYDELATRFNAQPESLLASHLISDVIRSKGQKSEADSDASRMWLLRSDGLLIAAQMIISQEILGFCRWYAAAGGAVREIEIDARNELRLCVERGGELRHERRDAALFLHAVVASSCDLAGMVEGLELHEGRQVWACAEGYVLGPFTVDGGAIDLGDVYAGEVLVGLFQPPKFETMPRYRILPNDEIVHRPGRIHTAFINVIDTTSIAVGANGGTARNLPLSRIGDPADAPVPAATRKLTVAGLLGMAEGTTLTITQTRPGRLRVRDFALEEAL